MADVVDYQALYEQTLLSLQQSQNAQQEAQAKINQLEEQLALAIFELNKARRKLFGRTSDNRHSKAIAPNQLELFDLGVSPEDLQVIGQQTQQAVKQAQAETLPEENPTTARKKWENNKRMTFPVELPRVEVMIHPKADLEELKKQGYSQIGQEVTEILEITPASFYVKRIIRTKWALEREQQFVQDVSDATIPTVLIAPIPSRTVAKGLFGESLLAYLVIGKYIDHLPLHRQIKIFERSNIHLAASTVSDNIAAVAQLLLPLYNSLKREVLANRYLQADESPIKVQDHEKQGACHLGYFWAYHAPVSKLVLFEYQKGRGREGPANLLKDFEGILQTDGYVTYTSLFEKSEKVKLGGCMAHARRYFDEAVNNDAARAKHVITEIAKLYAIEQQIRDTPGMEERDICLKRMREASPILEALQPWLQAEAPKVTPSSPIGKAVTYTLKLWDRLTLYLFHGQLQIDNNLIENLIRPIALGRKNYLFCGSHSAAQHAAIIYSLLGSCQRNNIKPQEWLCDVLEQLHDNEYEGKFSDLLPNRWKKESP